MIFSPLQNILSGAAGAAVRFPLPLACATFFAALVVNENHEILTALSDDTLARCMTFLVQGFFLSLAVRLLAESRDWRSPVHLPLAAGGLAMLFVITVWSAPTIHSASGPTVFMVPALVLAATTAPFVAGGGGNAAFWRFNQVAWLCAAFAGLAALVLFAGIAFALLAVDSLFGIDVDEEFYGDAATRVWSACSTGISTRRSWRPWPCWRWASSCGSKPMA